MWTPEFDEWLRGAVKASVASRHYDDALQEARLAVLQADDSHTPAWYRQRAVGAARNYACREDKQPIPMDMGALTERVASVAKGQTLRG